MPKFDVEIHEFGIDVTRRHVVLIQVVRINRLIVGGTGHLIGSPTFDAIGSRDSAGVVAASGDGFEGLALYRIRNIAHLGVPPANHLAVVAFNGACMVRA